MSNKAIISAVFAIITTVGIVVTAFSIVAPALALMPGEITSSQERDKVRATEIGSNQEIDKNPCGAMLCR